MIINVSRDMGFDKKVVEFNKSDKSRRSERNFEKSEVDVHWITDSIMKQELQRF